MKKWTVSALVCSTASLLVTGLPQASTLNHLPARNQVIESVTKQEPIVDGKYLLITLKDQYIDKNGKPVKTASRQSVVPSSSKETEFSSVQVQTINGQLATLLVPKEDLESQLRTMWQSANIVRILAIDGTAIEETNYAYKGFHLGATGFQYDTPWANDDNQVIAGINAVRKSSRFVDLDSGRWSEGSVYLLASKGTLHGVGSGKFAPVDPVTRAQFFTMLAGTIKSMGFDLKTSSSLPTDIEDAPWAKDYASAIKGYIDSVETGVFDKIFDSRSKLSPNQPIKRCEAAQIMSFFVSGDDVHEWKFSDWDGGIEKNRVSRLIAADVISGTGEGKFGPTDELTREQMASLAARLMYAD